MPDSFPPPTWGPPFDERDLDALLSGDTADTPVALRQVADALIALRAAPARAELSGEAAALAEFRAARLNEAAHADGHAQTLVLAAQVPDRGGRRPARHRAVGAQGAGPTRPGRSARRHRARPPGRRLGRRGGVLMAAAAAALIVVVIAVTVGLSGPIHNLGHSSATGKSSSGHQPVPSGSQNVQAGSATPDPSRTVTPTRPAPRDTRSSSPTPTPPAQSEASRLCRTYYGYYQHLQPRSTWFAELTLFNRIAGLAGSPSRVRDYCAPYLDGVFPPHVPWNMGGQQGPQPGSQNDTGPGNQGNGQSGPGKNDPGQPQQTGQPA